MCYGMGCQTKVLQTQADPICSVLLISQPSYRLLRAVMSILGNMSNLRPIVFLRI
jgi:hypothetical protein